MTDPAAPDPLPSFTGPDGTVHTIQAHWPGHGYIVTSSPAPESAPQSEPEAS